MKLTGAKHCHWHNWPYSNADISKCFNLEENDEEENATGDVNLEPVREESVFKRSQALEKLHLVRTIATAPNCPIRLVTTKRVARNHPQPQDMSMYSLVRIFFISWCENHIFR